MSYIRADEILPRELLETVQRYVSGVLLYVPCTEKQEWGSGTSARDFFRERNIRIRTAYEAGASTRELASCFSLSEKSIQRILREQRADGASGAEGP